MILKTAELHTYASEHAITAVLLQRDENDVNRSNCFYFANHIRSIKSLWPYRNRNRSARMEYLETYYKAFKFIFDSKSILCPKKVSWQLELQCYSCDIKLQGKEHIADFTSRVRYSKNTILSEIGNPEQFYVNFITRYAISMSMLLSLMKEVSETDNEIQSILEGITTEKWFEQPVKHYEKTKFEFKENYSFNVRKITRASSDCSPSGSLNNLSNKSLLREEVFSENLERDIVNFITDRIACQANTNVPNPTPKGSRETYHAIFSAHQPQGIRSLLDITNLYSRSPLVVVMKSTNTAAVIDQFERLFSIFGYPKLIKDDNGLPFGIMYSRMNQVKFVEDSL